jgi:Cof subfamily protein (haloacid dehalogenase superfamily)
MGVHIDDTFSQSIRNYKAAFFDIDGTIFKSNFTISRATVDFIKRLQKLGVKTCLATGRPYFGSLKVIEELGIRDPSMFSSGGIVIDPESKSVLFKDIVTDSLLPQLLNEMKMLGVHLELYSHDKYFIEESNEISKMHLEYLVLEPVIGNFSSVLREYEINKVVAISTNKKQLKGLEEVAAKFPTYSYAFSFGAAHPEHTFLNITGANSSRKKVFQFFLEHFRIEAKETLAFGDADADIAFLENAGLGIAVENATDKAKKAAKYITRSVDDDGVVYALQAMGV